jgi:uncharacterized hydrophobic protein (TIGR00271 family)
MKKILDFISLNTGEEDKAKVLENVKSNITFRGSNLWILACAIVVASVGLNVNSTAVIIGAMLISPLMGPIVGAGFGLGMFDFTLLRRSLKNLLNATIVGLLVATIYFFLSPFKETQSELLARTSPNIYDVLIAFFGGLVGVIAITRVEKGNPIPGVAIATALMPPLCTAGYGLAIGNWQFFLGALYLYTINCVFICISTFLIVKYLKYPATKLINEQHQKRIKYTITGIILILIIPSFYLAYNMLNEKKYTHKINDFINKEFVINGYTIIYKEIDYKSNPKKIELAFLSKKFSQKEVAILNHKLKEYELPNTLLRIKQDTTDLKNIILNEINGTKSFINQKDIKIASLEKQIVENQYNNNAILAEAKIIFPEIQNLSIANHIYYTNTDSQKTVPILIYYSKTELTNKTKDKLKLWLKQKLQKSELEIYRHQ